jgi:hypothetical protein
VWALLVVVAGVLPKDPLEMATTENECPIEALCSDRPHPAFRVGIGSRRSDRRLDDSDALRSKYLVEAGRELGVPIPNEELDRSTPVHKVCDQVAGHLSDERTGGMLGNTQDVNLPGREFDDEERVELF